MNIEITPIHGNSCLVTLMRKDTGFGDHEPPLTAAVLAERNLGMERDWFYLQYRGQVGVVMMLCCAFVRA